MATRSPIEALESRLLFAAGPRQMEYLGRGVVATRASSSNIFVSWRSMAQDAADMAFNVYRSTNGGTATKLNSTPLSGGTNYTDTTASSASSNYSYFVKPVVNNVEQTASASYTLKANTATGPLFSIPLRNIGDYYVQHTSVGDLDGDGEYDFVVNRLPNQPGMTQRFEAYRRDGTFLWSVDCGPNSLNQNNIEPGSSAISVGNWDGVAVYDLDNDGKAEVLYRSSNGVVFGDGTTLSNPANDNVQFISVLNGMTGAERARIQIPTDYISDGPLAPAFAVGYFDGVHPSLVAKMKNRVGSGPFNLMVVAWDFDGANITQKWKWNRGNTDAPDGHQVRIVDVDQDGKDEFVDIGYVLNGDGTLRYSMAPQGIVHGDRFHIGDLDPDRPGLEGYGVQQDNPSLLYEYYYDAATGEILHTHYGTSVGDVGRGIAADIDPNYRGYEYWSFSGIYNSRTTTPGAAPVETKLTDEPNRPWPNFRIWWDGDVLSENLNNETIDKWNPATQGTSRVSTLYNYGATDTWRDAPTFYGDIIGDWREEVVFEKSDHTALQIYTTQIASSTRLYTLAQNPEYRNSMTVKGYLQSHMVDYYLGSGMSAPPTPNIVMHAPTSVIVPPAAPTNLVATAGSGGVQVNLAWSAVAGAASYKVRRSTTNGGPWAVIGTPTGTTFTDPNIAPNGGTYYYVVTQVTSGGSEGMPSNQASITIGQPGTSNTYQAEDASVTGNASIATNHSGYNGTGFVDFGGTGGILQWNNVDGGGGGTGTFTFRYALGSTSTRTGTLTINGASQPITFSGNGSWNSWQTISVAANVTPGTTNTVRLESTGQDLANVDQVQIDVPAPPLAYTGGSGADTYYVRRNGANIDVWINGNGTGLPTYRLAHASTPSLSFSGGAGNDSLTIDLSNGNALPTQGISFDGGADTDTLAVVGSSGDDAFTFNATSVAIGATVTQVSVEQRSLSGNGGTDQLAVNGGAVALASVLNVDALTIAAGATLDVKNFALVHDYDNEESPLPTLAALINSARSGGNWLGTGITSTTARTNPQANTTLGIIEASDYVPLFGTTFAGQAIDSTAVLIKYTYYGDANFDGRITFDDYVRIDTGFVQHRTGWSNGDFNLDGVVNFDDYVLIDVAFNSQGSVLSSGRRGQGRG